MSATATKKYTKKASAKKSSAHRVVKFSGRRGSIPSSEIRRAVEAVASRRTA